MTNSLSISTFNVYNSTKNVTRIIQLFDFIKSDIVCIQETKFKNKYEAAYFEQIFNKKYDIKLSHCEKDDVCAGIGLMIKHSSVFKFKRKIFELNGRAIGSICEYGKKLILLIGIYFPADQPKRVTFIEKLFKTINDHFRFYDECIILGDFNYVEDFKDRSHTFKKQREIGID
jgi:exonuclease III